MSDIRIKRLTNLFAGLPRAYGTYVVDEQQSEGTVKKSGRAKTIAKAWGDEQWKAHLAGTYGLGIVPIRDDGTCMWAAIDIDEYAVDVPKKLCEFVQRQQLPAVVCRTKSGGGHLYFFFSEPIAAGIVRDRLRDFAKSLGFAGAEVFPKQSSLNPDIGETGNWLNMPYFNGDKETLRYAYNARGKAILDVDEFLDYAEALRLSEAAFRALEIPDVEHDFEDGPPCLQRLAASKVGSGGRNIALFQFAMYAKSKFRDAGWQDKVLEYNSRYFDPSLPYQEVRSVISQHEKKEYRYKCTEEPMASVCKRDVCLRRQFGIAGRGVAVAIVEVERMIGDLKKLVYFNIAGKPTKDPPKWLLTVNDEPVEFSTAELQNQRQFQARCMEKINLIPESIPTPEWNRILQACLDRVEIVEVPFETSPLGLLLNQLSNYIALLGTAQSRNDLFRGLALKEEDAYLFKADAFAAYLSERMRTTINMPDVWARLHECGVTRHETTVSEGKSIRKLNYWRVPLSLLSNLPEEDSTEEEGVSF